LRTDPEALQAVTCAEGEGDAKRECEYVVREHVEERTEVLPTLTAQHAAARASETVGDLERSDERHHFAHKMNDCIIIAEEVTEDLYFTLFE
jgi:hypothetical protein